MSLKLGTEQVRYVGLFENITGAMPMDCLIPDDEGELVFVVKSDDMGKAIGKGGSNVKKFMNSTGKSVDVIEFSEDIEGFVKNIYEGVDVKIENVRRKKTDEDNIAMIKIPSNQRPRAIGRGGRNVRVVKRLLKRHHDIDDVNII